ncbi:polysaccharide pyruvyl transferase family protein [Aliarcobacter cryaerophilus]|uniref:polysaccharide pyruvyl transferase family protein n=1 Tax=Aliarcobacter cryaerophilus TaxID=28198 RepID=UPI0021B2F254|nr:polysaccharide pyruvyl transferase family protein [Aliarcobacter cryaerophilus]MCT7523340.1 polysaccharide pyruvyl transferase family protein [Aliarcobacter cryaerophilus]
MALKIGILTLPIAENYGGILQAVALYKYLNNQGHDVVFIYKITKEVLWKRIIRKILLKIPFHNLKNIKINHKLKIEWKKRKAFHRVFIEREILKISEDLYTKQDLENFTKKEKFDAIIVGSDQVWRKTYINDKYYKSYFLDFVDANITKKIAYAASFGKDYWEGKDDIDDISKLLKDFTAISTREKSGIDICKNIFTYSKVKHVLDPTLLMNKEFYKNEIISKYEIKKTLKCGLVTYVLDEEDEKKEIINFIKDNLDIDSINHLKGFNKERVIFSVPEWLSSFENADFVVTDSFHGMVFSIIFEKDFIVIGNESRGMDRFMSLLNLLGLENRLILKKFELEGCKLEKINFNKVKEILNEERILSEEFLIEALS